MSDVNPVPPTESKFIVLSNRRYDLLKFIAQILLPGVITLYGTLALIWGLPRTEEVVASVGAFNVFLGLMLSASSRQYNAPLGELELYGEDDAAEMLRVNLDEAPEYLRQGDTVKLKVRKMGPSE